MHADFPFAGQLQAASKAATLAEKGIRKYFNGSFDVDIKEDNSPVTVADVEAEKTIRASLLDDYADYGFYGEETGQLHADASHLWLVDPIDGTKSFVRHSPFFSTQIALMSAQGLVVGVSNAPCYGADAGTEGGGERVEAALGFGCRFNGREVYTSDVTSLEKAYLSAGNLKTMANSADSWQRYGQLIRTVARVRGYGDFCHYHQLVSGQADLVVESDVNILDIAALVVAVREAGGVFTDLQGGDITLETTSVLAAATPELHAAALSMLSV